MRNCLDEKKSSGKVSDGKMSAGKLSVGKKSDGKVSVGKCLLRKCTNGKMSNGKLFGHHHYRGHFPLSKRKVRSGATLFRVMIVIVYVFPNAR